MQNEGKKTTGGIIVARDKNLQSNEIHPLFKIGTITIIKRIVLSFQMAGVSPIVVITGHNSEDIEHELINYGVIFLKNQKCENSQLFDYAKIGLDYLKNKCDQIIFNPVSIAMFTPETIKRLIESGEKLISPSYHGKSGHPLFISSELIPGILEYKGDMGLRGAIQNSDVIRKWLEVEDEGILQDTDAIEVF